MVREVRPPGTRKSVRSRVVGTSIAAGAIAGLVIWRLTSASMSPCESEVRTGDQRRAVELCLDSYARTGDEHDLAWAAKAYMYLGELTEAERRARQLLQGPFRGDGDAILSYVALRNYHPAAARGYAIEAFAAHKSTGDERGMANDAASLSEAAWRL